MTSVFIELLLFGVFVTLSAADWALTRIILGNGGVEANPVMSLAYKWFGMTGIAAIKGVIATLVVRWQVDGILPNWGILICIAAYTLTIFHLVREVKKMGIEASHHSLAQLIDPRTFSALQWASLVLLVFGPITILMLWESATVPEFQFISSFVMMAAIAFFASCIHYPKIGEVNDPTQ